MHSRARTVHGRQAVPDIEGTVLVALPERFVYIVGDRVVKIEAEPAKLAVEAETQRAVRRAGCPAPEVRALHLDAPGVLVMSLVDGEPLADGPPPHRGPDTRWRAVGRALRGLHSTPVDGRPVPVFGRRTGWWEWFSEWVPIEHRHMVQSGAVPRAELDLLCGHALAAFRSAPEPERRQLHGDCGPYHWLLRGDDVVAVVDFGDAGLGDPAWDLAVLTLSDTDRLPALLDGYGTEPGFRSYLNRMLVPYQIIRHLAAHSWLVEHGFDATPTVHALRLIAERLRNAPSSTSASGGHPSAYIRALSCRLEMIADFRGEHLI